VVFHYVSDKLGCGASAKSLRNTTLTLSNEAYINMRFFYCVLLNFILC
jgi:hypothetical protein